VSVVVPTVDRAGRVTRTVASALAQRDVAVEVIAVDDGSVDDTPARLAALAGSDPRLRVLRHERRAGVARARNAGIAVARGEWLAFLDDDDLWAPDKLARQLTAAEAAGAPWVYCAALLVDDRLHVLDVWPAPVPADLARDLRTHQPIPASASNVCARADLVRRADGFDETFFQLADWDLWLRLAAVATPAACEEPLVAYVEHSANMVVTNGVELLDEAERLFTKHHTGERFDPRALVEWAVVHKRRGGQRAAAARMAMTAARRFRSPVALRLAAGALVGRRPESYVADPQRDAVSPAWLREAGGPVDGA
jgi:glycosyltransferase involved in cell wall biosynthesis